MCVVFFVFFQAEDGIRDATVTGVQTCALPICSTSIPARAGTGMEVELGRVPQRETAMTPYEILLSESQERMLLVAARGREEEVRRVFARWELDAVEIGRVTAGGELCARLAGEGGARVPGGRR